MGKVRQDEIQLIITTNGKAAGKTFDELKKKQRDLVRSIGQLEEGTEDYIEATKALKQVNTRIDKIKGDLRATNKVLDKTKKKTGGIGASFKKLLPALGPAAIVAGTIAIAKGIFNIGKASLTLFNNQAKADAALKATLKSTGEVAGRTFDDLSKAARSSKK